MKNIAKLFAATVLLAGFNSVFADGHKEAVLNMGKGAFTLTVSLAEKADGPFDFGKNLGIGKAMDGQFQTQQVMFLADLENSTASVAYMATTQKIDPDKNGKKLTADHMARDQIKSNGFEGRATKFDCPPTPIDGATSVCYKMSGNATFDGKPVTDRKYAAIIVSTAWANNTQGYTLMGVVTEKNIQKFNADPIETEKSARRALGRLWTGHQVKFN